MDNTIQTIRPWNLPIEEFRWQMAVMITKATV